MASLLLAGAAALRAADLPPVHYQGQPTTNTAVTIQGTSTFHDWEMKGTSIGGFVEFPAGVIFDTNQASIPGLKDGVLAATGRATILVRSIHSQVEHLPDVMDSIMQGAMNQTNFPAIIYKPAELKLKLPHVAGKPFEFDAKGDLAISGVTNTVTFPVTITPLDKTKIKISGTAKLKMTSYGIKPPEPSIAGLGLMKCGDDVVILFDWPLAVRQQ
jgi:hypothetical protein